MKTINLGSASPSLTEILDLASEENVMLRTSEGRQYLLAEIDDFAEEIAKVRQNDSLMDLLAKRSEDKSEISISQVQEQLRKKKKQRKKSDLNGS